MSLVWVIGFYAIIFGILENIYAFRLDGLRRKIETAVEPGK